MPSFAIVTIVEAAFPGQAWESIEERLLEDDMANAIYIGAPWVVPADSVTAEPIEYQIDGIQIQLNGRHLDLDLAD
jgi:hypothetical protein